MTNAQTAVARFAANGWPIVATDDGQLEALCPHCRQAPVQIAMNGRGPNFDPRVTACATGCDPGEITDLLRRLYDPRGADDPTPRWKGDDVLAPACQIGRAKAKETDDGNAIRFVIDWRHEVRQVVGVGLHIYDGRRWRRDDDGAAIRRSRVTARHIEDEAGADPKLFEDPDPDADGEKLRKRRFAHAVRSQQLPRLEAMVKLASAAHELLVDANDIDADPWALNTGTGTLNLRTGQLRPHDRHDLLTQLVDVAYDPAATCPKFEKFLADVIPDPETRNYLQRVIGMAITGDVSEHVMFMLIGDGANGKTTLLNVLAAVLGDFAVTASSQTFTTAGANRAARSDLARLHGKRLVYASEIARSATIDESLIKEMTGGDRVTARFNHRDEFSYSPQFTLMLAANHLPAIEGTDNGIWRRIKVIPFTQQFDDHNIDRQLAGKLIAEAAGVLRWAVQGCVDWQTRGLGTCTAVDAATQAYRDSQDHVDRFLRERTTRDADSKIPNEDLHNAYADWCATRGHTQLDNLAFGKKLSAHGIPAGKSGSTRFRKGIRLTTGDPS